MTEAIYTYKVPANCPLSAYSHDELPGAFQDKRTLLIRIRDAILALLRSFVADIQSVPSRILVAFNRNPYLEYCVPEQPKTWNNWKEKSSGLHILTHGYHGHPATWDIYVKALRREDAEADVRVPFVTHQGNCALEHATDPIRDMIKNYIHAQIGTQSNKVIPIHIYGSSNGSRIALNLVNGLLDGQMEAQLQAKGLRLAIKVDAICGIIRGTTNWVPRFFNSSRAARWIAINILKRAPEPLDDFLYKSAASTKLIDSVRKVNDSANAVFKFNFYATTEDELVTPVSASLPVLGKGEIHHIMHGEGHASIVHRVLHLIMQSNKSWMQKALFRPQAQ